MTGKEVGRSRGRGGRTVEDAQKSGESHPALRERIFTLSAAILCINASLDMGSVFRDAADNARTFTKARYGAVATMDRAGEPRDYVTSGLGEDEVRGSRSAVPPGRRCRGISRPSAW